MSRAPKWRRAKAMASGMFISGMSPGEVVEEMGKRGIQVPLSTAKSWKKELTPEEYLQAERALSETIQDMLVVGVKEGLKATTAIARKFQDPEYLGKHTPTELMDAYEGISSWNVRQLHAMQAAAEAGARLDEGQDQPQLPAGSPDGEAIPGEYVGQAPVDTSVPDEATVTEFKEPS